MKIIEYNYDTNKYEIISEKTEIRIQLENGIYFEIDEMDNGIIEISKFNDDRNEVEILIIPNSFYQIEIK